MFVRCLRYLADARDTEAPGPYGRQKAKPPSRSSESAFDPAYHMGIAACTTVLRAVRPRRWGRG